MIQESVNNIETIIKAMQGCLTDKDPLKCGKKYLTMPHPGSKE